MSTDKNFSYGHFRELTERVVSINSEIRMMIEHGPANGRNRIYDDFEDGIEKELLTEIEYLFDVFDDGRQAVDILNKSDEARDLIEQLAGLCHYKFEKRLKVLRGNLDAFSIQFLVNQTAYPVLHFVVVAISSDDRLLRENHNAKGYHYHYADINNRRSDILLTFSRERMEENTVTWELHAVKKAKFQARVAMWGKEKRSSVHHACINDKGKRRIEDYLIPGKKHSILNL